MIVKFAYDTDWRLAELFFYELIIFIVLGAGLGRSATCVYHRVLIHFWQIRLQSRSTSISVYRARQ